MVIFNKEILSNSALYPLFKRRQICYNGIVGCAISPSRNRNTKTLCQGVLCGPLFSRRFDKHGYGSTTVIIGGGGNKKSRTYQENPKLDKEVKMLSRISDMITSALKDKDIYLNENGTFSGNLLLED
jgi:hypothetical protein